MTPNFFVQELNYSLRELMGESPGEYRQRIKDSASRQDEDAESGR